MTRDRPVFFQQSMRFLKFLIFIVLILFPFGQLTKIPLQIKSLSLYLHDLVIGLMFFYWFLFHLWKGKSLPKTPLTLPILGFISVALFSLLINSLQFRYENLVAFLYLLRWVAYSGVYFVVYDLISNKATKQQSNKVFKLLILAGIVVAIFGLIQYFFYPNLRNLCYLGWDPHQHRVFGTFFDPGFMGIILVLTLILLISFSWLDPLLRIGGGILIFLSLVLTYSRSSYLALIIGVFVLAWLKKNFRLFVIPLLLLSFVLGATFLPRPSGEGVRLERQSTVSARLENYRQTLKIIKDNLIFGVGFNRLRYVKKDCGFLGEGWEDIHSGAGADSSLLFVWATTGILGQVVYSWMWWEAVNNSKLKAQNSRRRPAEAGLWRHTAKLQLKTEKVEERTKDFYSCVLAITAALFIHSLFLNSLFYPWVMIWMWILLGTIHAALETLR